MTPFFSQGIGGIRISGSQPHEGTTICIHGGPGANCLTMYPFFPVDRVLGQWYFIDLPNHGRSASTHGDWTKERCIAQLVDFAAELPKPIRLLGLSFGANVALEWANIFPNDIELLVGVSGCGDIQSVIEHQSAVVQHMPPELLELMTRQAQATGPEADYLNNRVWLDSLDVWLRGNPGHAQYKAGTLEFRSNEAASQGYFKDWLEPYLHRSYIHHQLEQLSRFNIPALLIWGKDDRMGSPQCAMGYDVRDPNITCLPLENAGHCSFVDQPDIFFEALNRFFQEKSLQSE